MNLNKTETTSKQFMMNFLSNSPSNSVPELIKDEGRKQWVEWGVRDVMPARLFELYNQSGFHRAIIDSRVDMMTGNGIEQDIETEEEFSERTENFLLNPNLYEDMNSIFNKLAYDYEIFGIAYIEVIYSSDRKSIANINHIDASKIRWGKKISNHLNHIYYSDNWSRLSKYPAEAVPVFNPAIKEDYPRQILPIVRYTPSVDYYTLPSYYSVIKWISIDYEISNFHENNIKNGFAPTIMFDFPTEATEAEMKQTKDLITKQYGGTNKAGGALFMFHPPGTDYEVKVTTLDITDADKQYEWLKSTTQQEILVGHKVTNENLVGISTPGKLGSTQEMLQSYELYYNTVIKPEIKSIETAINKIMTYNGMNNIHIIKDTPISNMLSESTLTEVLTRDELRDSIGYEPIEVEEVDVPNEVESKFQKFEEEQDDELFFGEFNKESWIGDKFEMNGTKYTLSEDIIDAKSGIGDAKDTDLYIWTLGVGGLSKENCPACIKHSGKVRSLAGWKRVAIPGIPASAFGGTFKHGPYGTFCEADCTCKLIKIN